MTNKNMKSKDMQNHKKPFSQDILQEEFSQGALKEEFGSELGDVLHDLFKYKDEKK